MQKFIIKINKEEEIALDEAVECYLLSKELGKGFVEAFIKKAVGKIVLLEDLEVASELEADGAILDLSKSENIKKDFIAAKAKLKKGAVIGVITRNRRHETMLIAEQEPDFIIFRAWQDGLENTFELTSWYNEFFLIQSALLPEEKDINFKDFAVDIVILDKN